MSMLEKYKKKNGFKADKADVNSDTALVAANGAEQPAKNTINSKKKKSAEITSGFKNKVRPL